MFNTIPYGVTAGVHGHATNSSIANFPFMYCLPMMLTNYGGDLQLTNVENFQGYNTGFMFNGVAQQTYGIPGMMAGCGMPSIDFNSIQNNAAAGAQAILTPKYIEGASQAINTSCAAIDSAIKAYEAKIADSNTPADQKALLEQAVKDLKAKQEELESMKSSSDLKPDEAYIKANKLKDEVNKIIIDTNNAIIKAASGESSTTDPAKADESKADESKVDESKSDEAKTDEPKADKTKENDPTQQGGDDAKIDDMLVDYSTYVDEAFDALNGMGTKNNKIETLITDLCSANAVLPFMLAWNESKSAINGESFIEAFMDDADHDQARTYVPKIINSLIQQARNLGVYDDEFKACVNAANKEIYKSDSWGWFGALRGMNDKVVCENVDKMLQILATKLGSQNGAPSKA